jgi:xanthine dehydrogenase accessory factor
VAGNISGGCVDGAAVEEVLKARRTGTRALAWYGITDEQAIGVGLACGGTIDVLVEPAVADEVVDAADAGGTLDGHPPASVAVATVLPPGDGDRVVVRADGTIRSGSLGDPALDASLGRIASELLAEGVSRVVPVGALDVFVEVFPAAPRLVVVGAGQVAVHLAPIARELGFHVTVVDARPALTTPERFPDADRILHGWADEVADEAGIDADAWVVVLGHDAKLDEPAVATALRRGARYVGEMGSRGTLGERIARLRAQGIGEADLARLRSPIGLDLGGHDPGEVALAIMAEIVAVRHGRSGGPLSAPADAASAPPE